MPDNGLILAIDPGNVESAWVLYGIGQRKPIRWAKEPNGDVLALVKRFSEIAPDDAEHLFATRLAIEMVACYGMAAGRSLFDTAVWIGRFIQAWNRPYNKVFRKSKWGPGPEDAQDEGHFPGVCMTICKINTAKDPNIRQAIIDRYGGKATAIGCKASPGVLYGMKADTWSALAVAITWAEHMGGTPT